jgi:hypothetical protein
VRIIRSFEIRIQQIYTDEHCGFLEVMAAEDEVGEILPGELDDLLADCGFTMSSITCLFSFASDFELKNCTACKNHPFSLV